MIGFLYPGYMTLLALNGKSEADRAAQTSWLIYWTIYSCVTLFEDYAEFLVDWIPFYYPAKVSLLVYMMVPQLEGATKIYENLKPHLSVITGKFESAEKKSE